jgi:choline dehydrogenase-like flavoprotein
MNDADICIIGSGAGAGPVARQLARAGRSVIVLEKGPHLKQNDFYKDELACCRRSVYTPNLKDERHVIEDYDGRDANGHYKWSRQSTEQSGWDFWNGNVVGGASNFMSGYFYRLKPQDFRLVSEFGAIDGANLVDWPISYDDLEPYYTMVEHVVGISGLVTSHPFAEPRSTPNFPYQPTQEHVVARLIDNACEQLQFNALRTPRAILTRRISEQRRSCEYSGFCGSYGCASGAKGSSREALLNDAVDTGKCRILANCKVNRLLSDNSGKVTTAEYVDEHGVTHHITAKTFVVACQAVETARLLLLSTGPKHPHGLGNNHGQVGKNLVFSAGGSGYGDLVYHELDAQLVQQLKVRGPFVNRGLQDWYTIDDPQFGSRAKGGTIDFLLRHPNAINRANRLKWDQNDKLVWGSALKQKLKQEFTGALSVRYEIFCDWLPTDDCFVSLDPEVKDKWGVPVAKIRIGYHDHDLKVGKYLAAKAEQVLKTMGSKNIRGSISGSPPQNLQAGGCRFGTDPASSVLDPQCRIHDAPNVYISDGSWMPSGGSVPYTWTIYANAFRVADIIRLQG